MRNQLQFWKEGSLARVGVWENKRDVAETFSGDGNSGERRWGVQFCFGKLNWLGPWGQLEVTFPLVSALHANAFWCVFSVLFVLKLKPGNQNEDPA